MTPTNPDYKKLRVLLDHKEREFDRVNSWNLGDEESKSAKSGEDGMDDGEMDVQGVAEG